MSIKETAERLRIFHGDDEELMDLAKSVKSILPEKSDDYALLLASECKDGISNPLDWEIGMQIYGGLTKDQTTQLANLFA